MNIPFLGKSKTKKEQDPNEKVYLTLDIGTEFVKTVVYQVSGEIAEIIGYSRVPQHTKAMEGAMVINLDNVVSTCDIGIGKALGIADKTLGEQCPLPEYVTMGIAGELVKGVCLIANYERENPEETITVEEIENVVTSVKEQAFPESIEEIAEEIGSTPDKIKEISSHIDSTFIDGNKVDNPVGFTGSEVSYRVFSSFAPSIHVNSLFEIANRLELKILTIDVQPYAISKSFKGSHRKDFSSIFIDIGGGTTDIALVDKGVIIGTQMFAFGGRVFTKRLSKEMRLDLHEAERMKINYSKEKVQDHTASKIKSYINADVKLWAEGIELSLEEFEEVTNLPTEIFLSGGGSDLPDIKDTLMTYPWKQMLGYEIIPKISKIGPGDISNISDKTGLLKESMDVAPAALTSISVDLISKIKS